MSEAVKQARQGDVFAKEVPSSVIDQLRANQKKRNPLTTNIVAYGEVTGHCHKVCDPSLAELETEVDAKTGDIYMMNPTGTITLSHDEHGTITLDQGKWYCLTRQFEYDPVAEMQKRRVAD